MATKKVSPSEPIPGGSGTSSDLPWSASDRLTDPDGNVLAIQGEALVKVSSDDTALSHLDDKVATESPLAKAVLNPSGNEQVQIRIEDPNDGDQVLTGTNPASFGLAPLKHVEGDEAPSTAIPAALGQVNAFQVTVPSTGKYLLTCSGWATSDGAGVLELDLFNNDLTVTIANTLRKEGVTAADDVSLFTSVTADLTSGHVIHPRWAFTGGGNATLERVSLSLVRIGS